ncbi:MAG: hypothetical protein Q4C87_01425 [Actinomycetaceae bacterium]|nr:hypothetical protein [Actinomycetaceae bacterium]
MNAADTPQTDKQSPSQDNAELPANSFEQGVSLGIIAIVGIVILCMMIAFRGQLYMLRNPHPVSTATEEDSSWDDEHDTPWDEELEEYLQSRPDAPLPVDESAKDELMSGAYESPSPWLHDGYAQGVSEWKVTGRYMGVSADKSVIVFDESGGSVTTSYVVGRDIRTGKEKWRLNYGDSAEECSPSFNGVAYCAQENDEDRFSLDAIDFGSGKVSALGEINIPYSRSPEFVAAQSGQTLWTVTFPGLDGDSISDLISIKEGVIQWRSPIVEGSECRAADGVVVCETKGDVNRPSLEVFSTVSGRKVSQFEGLAAYQLFRDGLAIQTPEGGSHKYSWRGEKIGDLPFEVARLNVWTLKQNNVLPPLSSVDQLQGVRAVNSAGEPLVREEKEVSRKQMYLVDISTETTIGEKRMSLDIVANEKGSLYLLEDERVKATILYGEDGKEIFRRAYTENALAYYPDGIIYSIAEGEGVHAEITVYAPKGK